MTQTLPRPATRPYDAYDAYGTEADILDLYRAHLSKGRATVAELFGSHMEVASEGSRVWTADGGEYLNCGGYGVFVMGARHPIVMEAVLEQLHRHPTATRIMLEPTVARAAEALCSVTPDGMDRVHFALGGAEAVETGLKLARAHGRWRLVSFDRGYHGKTLGALSVTAKAVYQEPFRPLLPAVTHLPYGDAAALERVLAAHPGECCVIVEPVQGEGGVIIPPPGYLTRVEVLCRRHGGFLILDEVQTGMGRLGEWWGADLAGITPDVLRARRPAAAGGGPDRARQLRRPGGRRARPGAADRHRVHRGRPGRRVADRAVQPRGDRQPLHERQLGRPAHPAGGAHRLRGGLPARVLRPRDPRPHRPARPDAERR